MIVLLSLVSELCSIFIDPNAQYDLDQTPGIHQLSHNGTHLVSKPRPDIDGYFRRIYYQSRNGDNPLNLPVNYTVLQDYPYSTAMNAVRDQQQCGGCWAFAVTDVAASYSYIRSHNKKDNPIRDYEGSAQYQINCDHQCAPKPSTNCNRGCSGGMIFYAAYWTSQNGYHEPSCVAYKNGDRTCIHACDDGRILSRHALDTEETIAFYFAHDPNEIDLSNYIRKQLIFSFGPAAIQYTVYDDFQSVLNKQEIYKKSPYANEVEGHAVTCYGWGISAGGTSYWLAKNSWGEGWNDGGYFKIHRGDNTCGVESLTVFYAPATWDEKIYRGGASRISAPILALGLLLSFILM
ncbi:putative Cathepsin B [Blattamonas nauphoetae]|uniref:Cathepsin B n=1 Tax=Blattamonas nauphoetae TaxID=2049346 RepID=A0ABQ9XYA9_9EUKA|nr:putative Cathepsin B [Blattamonas nauphoetae]